MNASTVIHMDAALHNRYADMRSAAMNGEIGRQAGLCQYKRQLAETRSLLYRKQALRLVAGSGDAAAAEARRELVLKRVTREFWTNFVVRGEETAMLKSLQQRLRDEFGADLEFYYPAGDVQMVILHEGEDGPEPVKPHIQAAIVNRAYAIARDMVAAHMVQ